MRALPILLVGLLSTAALAGCFQQDPAAPLDDSVAPPPSPVVDFNASTFVHRADASVTNLTSGGSLLFNVTPALRSVGKDAAEPTMGVLKDGTLVYAALGDGDLLLPKTLIMVSRDQGLTWEDVSPHFAGVVSAQPFSLDPYTYVDTETGRIFSMDLYLACSALSFTDDVGETWVANPFDCGISPTAHDHQTISTSKPRLPIPTVGYPKIVYYCVNRLLDSACATSRNGGVTFGPLVEAYPAIEQGSDGGTPRQARCGGLHGHLAPAPDGTMYLPKDCAREPWVAFTRDDGLTWKQVLVNSTLGTADWPDPTVAADDDGNVYYMWVAEDGHSWLAVSTDGGDLFGPAIDVTAPGVTATHLPSIVAGGPGKVAFIYTGTTLEGGYGVKQSDKAWEDAFWHGYLGVIVNATSEDPVIVTTRVNPADDPLVWGHCGPFRCPGMYDFIDVVIDTNGRPWGTFVDTCPADCKSEDDSRASLGVVGTLATGPSLLAAGGMLPPLPEAPVAEGGR